jgi:hypothetical protein
LKSPYRMIAALVIALVASLSLAAAAPAKARDRNHDRIPDRWEKRHGLSLKVKQARRDQDRDGLTNLGEYRAGLHPRDPDTDDDGLEDGEENAGRVVALEGDVLTISLADGGKLSARVSADMHVKCRYQAAAPPAAGKSSMPEGEKPPEEPVKEEPKEEFEPEPDSNEKPEHEKEHRHDEYEHCGAEALVPGTRVSEAQLALYRGRLYWIKVKLG